MPVLLQHHLRYLLTALALCVWHGSIATGEGAGESAESKKVADTTVPSKITREGVVVDFTTRPTNGSAEQVMAEDWADVTFRITDANTGEPIRGRYPAAWMDLSKAWEAKGNSPMTCQDRVSTYLKGIVGVRPMIDLNSHFLLVMNRDASISVIDPVVGITGITNLFAQINLHRPGADWAKTKDQKQIFVSMPLAGKVALVDTETFKVVTDIEAGEEPTRVALQHDERYLWVANNARHEEDSGVTVLDAHELKKVAFIKTGMGHHEIAFTGDDRLAFVSNRDSGTVSVIDIQSLRKIANIETGPMPLSLAFTSLGDALYVADGKNGAISVVDPAKLTIRTTIQTQPGLGPMRFSNDGRWGVAVNPPENKVFVIDAATEKLAHTLTVGVQPYQMTFTRLSVYIRSLGSELVAMIPLSEFGSVKEPVFTTFPAGEGAPGNARDISIANSMVPAVKELATFVINQAEGSVYYYMEGMAAPMGAFRNYGHEARAIEIVDRSLSEQTPGVYTGRVKLPIEGTYDVAFMMDTPRFLHCFSATVVPNPNVRTTTAPFAVEFAMAKRQVPVGEDRVVKFRLTDPATGEPKSDIADVQLLYYPVAGGGRKVVAAKSLGDGYYEATLHIKIAATYYAFVGSRSEGVSFSDLPFFSLMGVPAAARQKPAASQSKPGGGA